MADTGVAASRWRGDLACVFAVAVGWYLFAGAVELQELLEHWLGRYEPWQADELPTTLLALACGMTWFAARRTAEARRELARRRAAEAHVSALLGHNRELAQQLISLQEAERRALARELHDELGQRLSALLLDTGMLRRRLDGPLGEAAARADDAAHGLYRLVAGLLRRLRPADLDTLGLVASLQALCEAWEAHSGVPCTFVHAGIDQPLPDDVGITVYRVAQESLTNVRRHARASCVRVRLARGPAEVLHLSVEDDGRGMAADGAPRGLGLLGASERAAAIGGELEVTSAPGAGVHVALRIPVSPLKQAA